MAKALCADRMVEIHPDRIVLSRYTYQFAGGATARLAWLPFDAARRSRAQVLPREPRSPNAVRTGFTLKDSYAVCRRFVRLALTNPQAEPGRE